MNHDLIIKATNRVGMIAAAALIYWVFVFLIIIVFDLKIFREHMTEMFFLSVFGILAVLGGAVVLNVMANLSKISATLAARAAAPGPGAPVRSRGWWMVALSLPVIAGGLFLGDYLSAKQKERLLVGAADRLVAENQAALASLSDYRFSPAFVQNAGRTLRVINRIDKNFPEVMVIVEDAIDGKPVYLGFRGESYSSAPARKPRKEEFICPTSEEERAYLAGALAGKDKAYRFRAQKGNYELYFPTIVNGKSVVLYFSDYQRYGKWGS